MSILLNKTTKVIVQGITGGEGRTRAKLMKQYGTNIVGGVSPGKGGEMVEELPVFDLVKEAVDYFGGIDASVIFVPAPGVKDAAIEAIEAGIKFLVLVPDRVPLHDVLEIDSYTKDKDVSFLGPNTLGILSPGKAVMGMMGGRAASAKEWFKIGPVGVSSRSGGITSSIAYYLGQAGIGQTTIVHVGGDPMVGLPHPKVMKLFEADPETKAMVMFGEIGGSQEETVAEMIIKKEITKPVIAYIGGKGAREGTRFSHAGAIIEGGRGGRDQKVKMLQEAGAYVVDDFADIPKMTLHVLNKLGVEGLVA